MKLNGITALITGATQSIGRATALELAKNHIHRLIIIDRDRQNLSELAQEVRAYGVEAITLTFSFTQVSQVSLGIAQVWRAYGPIDLLVNCAEVVHPIPFLQSKLSDFQEEISISLIGLYAITRSIARQMATRRQGTIVNVSSLAGRIAVPMLPTYSATQFAILGFTQALRGELAKYNIRVIALLSPLIHSETLSNTQWFCLVAPKTVEKIADILVQGVRQDRCEILIGWQSHIAIWCSWFAPKLIEKRWRVTLSP